MKSLIVVLLCLVALTLNVPAQAAPKGRTSQESKDSKEEFEFTASGRTERKEALRGLKAVGLYIQDLSPAAARRGITERMIQDIVELQLSLLNITVLPGGKVPETLGEPFLCVYVAAVEKTAKTVHAFDMRISLVETVRSGRNPSKEIRATTWLDSELVLVTMDDAGMFVRTTLMEMLKRFADEYQSVNPKDESLEKPKTGKPQRKK